jgi:hypothetical protein
MRMRFEFEMISDVLFPCMQSGVLLILCLVYMTSVFSA